MKVEKKKQEEVKNDEQTRPDAWLRNKYKRERPIESSIKRKNGKYDDGSKEEKFLNEDDEIERVRQKMYFMNSRGERKKVLKPGASVAESSSSRGDYKTQASSRMMYNDSIKSRQ